MSTERRARHRRARHRVLPPATVPGEGFWSWASQEKQYALVGEPGITYEHHDSVVGEVKNREGVKSDLTAPVDVLLLYSPALVGILCHYPETIRIRFADDVCHVLEEAGNVSMWVRPDVRRTGIGRRLLAEAERRWSIDWWSQTYTAGGRALIVAYLNQPEGDRMD